MNEAVFQKMLRKLKITSRYLRYNEEEGDIIESAAYGYITGKKDKKKKAKKTKKKLKEF
jgi:hypothetical protein